MSPISVEVFFRQASEQGRHYLVTLFRLCSFGTAMRSTKELHNFEQFRMIFYFPKLFILFHCAFRFSGSWEHFDSLPCTGTTLPHSPHHIPYTDRAPAAEVPDGAGAAVARLAVGGFAVSVAVSAHTRLILTHDGALPPPTFTRRRALHNHKPHHKYQNLEHQNCAKGILRLEGVSEGQVVWSSTETT